MSEIIVSENDFWYFIRYTESGYMFVQRKESYNTGDSPLSSEETVIRDLCEMILVGG
jgi:hypothetical protein